VTTFSVSTKEGTFGSVRVDASAAGICWNFKPPVLSGTYDEAVDGLDDEAVIGRFGDACSSFIPLNVSILCLHMYDIYIYMYAYKCLKVSNKYPYVYIYTYIHI
jgi:hypothetical protein